jgi:hypothetical protein
VRGLGELEGATEPEKFLNQLRTHKDQSGNAFFAWVTAIAVLDGQDTVVMLDIVWKAHHSMVAILYPAFASTSVRWQ